MSKRYLTSPRALLLAGSALLALPTAAQAQDQEQVAADANAATQAAEPASTVDTGEIVVTARRRVENLIDVPIAVTAYSGAALERQGATDITDLGDTTPNVTLEPSRGTNTTLTAFIRGVGQQDPVAGFESGVGIYLDDVYLNRPQAAVLDIYDVERIEVLRGPQGTLYGRNTIGGAIKYVTRRLSNNTTFNAKANLGTYKQADLILSGSTPLSDTVRIGLAGARLSRGGFGENRNNGVDNYNKDIWAARASAEFDVTPDFFIRVSGDYSKDNSEPRNGHRLTVGLLSGAPILDDVYDTRAGLDTPEQEVEAYGGMLRAEYKVSDAITLKNILSYRKDKTQAAIDFDSLPAADVDVPAIYKNWQFSNEFQVTYESDRLQGLAGVYYLNANANNIFDVVLATTSPVALPGLTASTFGDVDTKTWAAFADFTFDVTRQIAVSVGGRYTHDRRDATVIRANLLNGPSPELGGNGVQLGALTSNFEGKKTFKEFTPRASISFQPDDNNTLYASYAKGFKGGGFDPRGLSTAAPDLDADGTREPDEIFDYFLFEPETVNSYELGYKAALFDRRLRFAVAGFIADYKDVQIPGSVGAVINNIPTFVGVTTNAGKAKFKGIEIEGTAALLRNPEQRQYVNVSGTLGYLDAQFKEYITNIPGRGPVDVADFRKVQNTPKWTMSGSAEYGVAMGTGDLSLSSTLSYRSKTYQFELPSPFLDQKGYALLDASLVWSSEADRFTIGLHGKNILDKRYKTSGYQFLATDPVTGVPLRAANGNVIPSLGRESVATAFYGNPRQVVLSLGYKF
ncbi:TonB-dependent receptor [Sphingomonas sp. LY29]|uniref:TonB-dependent receptor n=1 Tax=Sphingomonas sp. LY29 TaxID=3095341 RepID=UPI002D78BE75|nr:TonB-dependent receptor [Sphingomonas sp. LY29]WRP24981.1 TonB-dependent receptor [Sphingomonas sp. LY29]